MKSIGVGFAMYMISASERGEMYYGAPASFGKFAAFFQGYALAIDQVGGRTIHDLDDAFCRFMTAKLIPNSLVTQIHWHDVIERMASDEQKKLKLFKENWIEFCVSIGLLEKIDGGVKALYDIP